MYYRVSVPLKKFFGKKKGSLWHKKREWTSRVLSGETLDDTWGTLRSTSTIIFKVVIPRNRCINVICTQSHKIASVEAIQSYSFANTTGGRMRCYCVFLTGSVHAVDSGRVEPSALYMRSFQSHVNTRNERCRSADNSRHTRCVVAWRVEAWCAVCVRRITGPIFLDTLNS